MGLQSRHFGYDASLWHLLSLLKFVKDAKRQSSGKAEARGAEEDIENAVALEYSMPKGSKIEQDLLVIRS